MNFELSCLPKEEQILKKKEKKEDESGTKYIHTSLGYLHITHVVIGLFVIL